MSADRTLTGFGPTFVEALYSLADLVEQQCPAARPVHGHGIPERMRDLLPTEAFPAHLEAWAEGDQWRVSAKVRPL